MRMASIDAAARHALRETPRDKDKVQGVFNTITYWTFSYPVCVPLQLALGSTPWPQLNCVQALSWSPQRPRAWHPALRGTIERLQPMSPVAPRSVLYSMGLARLRQLQLFTRVRVVCPHATGFLFVLCTGLSVRG